MSAPDDIEIDLGPSARRRQRKAAGIRVVAAPVADTMGGLLDGRNAITEHLSQPSAQRLRAAGAVYEAKQALRPPGVPMPDRGAQVEPLIEEMAVAAQVAKALLPVTRFTEIKHTKDGWRAFRFTGCIWEEGAWGRIGDDLALVLESLPKPTPDELAKMGLDGRMVLSEHKKLRKAGTAKLKAREKWLSDRGLRTMRNLIAGHATLREAEHAWDSHPELLATPTGVLNLRTGDIMGDPAALRLTQQTGAAWEGPDAPAPLWHEFLRAAVPDEELRAYLQLASGTFLIGSGLDHGMYLPLGPTGTGKGTFAETLIEVLGEGVAVAADRRLFSAKDEHTTSIADLRGRRMAWIDEVEFGGTLSESRLKNITGGGKIPARKMYENNVASKVTHTFLITTNDPLRTTHDDAVWRRLRYLPFEQPITGVVSKAVKEAAATGEGPGILAWIAAGAREVLVNPWRLDALPAQVIARNSEVRGSSDHLATFLECETLPPGVALPGSPADPTVTTSGTEDLLSGTTATELELRFAQWCRNNRFPTMDRAAMGKRLKALGVPTLGNRQKRDGAKQTVYDLALKAR